MVLEVTTENLPDWIFEQILVAMDNVRWRCELPRTIHCHVSGTLSQLLSARNAQKDMPALLANVFDCMADKQML